MHLRSNLSANMIQLIVATLQLLPFVDFYSPVRMELRCLSLSITRLGLFMFCSVVMVVYRLSNELECKIYFTPSQP